jgi:ribonuclease-3
VKSSESGTDDLEALEAILNYKFTDRVLLERAITHRSWAFEHARPASEAQKIHNEVFEFLGDSVLGLIVADYLFRSYPSVTEGELSQMKHRLVSTSKLGEEAERLSLGRFLRVGHGEGKSGGRRKRALLGDLVEALIAAVFLDGGLTAAEAFVDLVLGADLAVVSPASAAAADYKTLLQETLAQHRTSPHYVVVETAGPPHQRMFHVEVRWNDISVAGEGRTIKSAEIAAARTALEMIGCRTTEAAEVDPTQEARS